MDNILLEKKVDELIFLLKEFNKEKLLNKKDLFIEVKKAYFKNPNFNKVRLAEKLNVSRTSIYNNLKKIATYE